NQEPGAPIQRLQQFDSLALANRESFDYRIWIDGQLELIGKCVGLFRGFADIQRESRSRLCAERDVLGDAHRFDEHEMLVEHSVAKRDRFMWILNIARHAVYQDFSTVR